VLVETLLLLATCSGSSQASCKAECSAARGSSYTICAERGSTSKAKTKPKVTQPKIPKPKRLCSYYVNGTIDTPTASVITAWVEVGSRLCIGDPVPKPATPIVRTVAEEATDAFTAYATAPFAYFSPNRQIEIAEPVGFGVNVGGGSHGGTLFGSPAEIRFIATGVSWRFSDGQTASGRYASMSFSEPQILSAYATVNYRIDYRYPNASWVTGAAYASLDSNRVSLEVIDPPRRSLLRD
jgi:hypothetical protein